MSARRLTLDHYEKIKFNTAKETLMDTWYSLNLGDGIEAYQPLTKIKEAFWLFFTAAGGPHDMVVLSREDPETNIITAYFSPHAHETARLFNAIPCKKPSKDDRLIIHVGDVRAWNIFYPGTE